MAKDHPFSDAAISLLFPEYCSKIASRLRAGADTYGDESFGKGYLQLLEEIESEILDISGWSFVLWVRLQDIKRKLSELHNLETN